jgi:uncharacterized protein (TIGR03067 family)
MEDRTLSKETTMKTRLLALAAVGLFLAAAAPKADNFKDDDAKKELEKWQGTWTLVGAEEKGQKASDEDLKKVPVTLVIKDDKFTIKFGDQMMEGTFKLDPAKKPKAYDAKGTDAQGNTHQSIGIYEIDGDMLKVCFVQADKERPKEFKTGATSEAALHTYKKK